MRSYGRVYPRDSNGVIIPGSKGVWVEVDTDASGDSTAVYLTTLCQVLQLNLNESPFYANYGIPAHPAVIQQIFPDYFIWQTQRQFSPYFASLIVAKSMLLPTAESN
jgi:hypothetical protein